MWVSSSQHLFFPNTLVLDMLYFSCHTVSSQWAENYAGIYGDTCGVKL